MGAIKIGKVILRSLFKKSACKMYPVVPREYPENTRGHVAIVPEDCIACGICEKKCPANAIVVDRKARTWTIERMQCIQCKHCVDNCPKSCLSMGQTYTTPETSKVVDTFEIPKKEAKKADGAASADGGKLKCDLDQCVFCGLCKKNCPCGALEVDRKEKIWKVDYDACVECGACVDKCPKKCLTL